MFLSVKFWIDTIDIKKEAAKIIRDSDLACSFLHYYSSIDESGSVVAETFLLSFEEKLEVPDAIEMLLATDEDETQRNISLYAFEDELNPIMHAFFAE